MPHDQPWLDDYRLKLKAEELQRKTEEDRVFNTQNAALRAAINCPFPLRKPSDCQMCGEENCINAYQEQNKLWPEKYEEPVCHANTTSTSLAVEISPAASKLQNTPKFHHPGQPASGSGLFGHRNDEEKAA